jgi:hypothetical protein
MAFLSLLEQEIPASITRISLVLDNLKIHKEQPVQAWLRTHPGFISHFTLVRRSWMSHVE